MPVEHLYIAGGPSEVIARQGEIPCGGGDRRWLFSEPVPAVLKQAQVPAVRDDVPVLGADVEALEGVRHGLHVSGGRVLRQPLQQIDAGAIVEGVKQQRSYAVWHMKVVVEKDEQAAGKLVVEHDDLTDRQPNSGERIICYLPSVRITL